MSERYSLDGVEVEAVPPGLALHTYGVFTTFVAVDGTVLGWAEHRDRLAEGASRLWGHVLDERRLSNVVGEHLSRLRGPARVRVSIYPESISLASPRDAAGCRVLVSSGPCEFPVIPSHDFKVRTVEHVRDLPGVKATSLATQIWLRREAQLAGYDDALFRHGEEVLEGTTWSVVVWRDGEVATPGGAVLRSITAGHVGRVASDLGWRFRRRGVSLQELTTSDLVLAVNAISPGRALQKVDDVELNVDQGLLTTVIEAYSALRRDPVVP